MKNNPQTGHRTTFIKNTSNYLEQESQSYIPPKPCTRSTSIIITPPISKDLTNPLTVQHTHLETSENRVEALRLHRNTSRLLKNLNLLVSPDNERMASHVDGIQVLGSGPSSRLDLPSNRCVQLPRLCASVRSSGNLSA